MMFLVDGALVVFHFHAVVAVALALQFVAIKRFTFTSDFTCNIFLIVRTSVAVLVGRLVGVVSWFSFAHSPVIFKIPYQTSPSVKAEKIVPNAKPNSLVCFTHRDL